MYYYEVAPLQIVRRTSTVFTYHNNEALVIGQIVKIEVGRKNLNGVVIRQTSQPNYATKQIASTVYETPLPEPLINLSLWLSGYYATHLALVLQMILPKGLEKNRRIQTKNQRQQIRKRTQIVFNDVQRTTIDKIRNVSAGTILLHGITGSGKTRVYIECARETLQMGRSVIVLVPEIALTPQVIDEFSQHFNNVVMTHSRQTEAERHLAWQKVLSSDTPQVIIGPRSALFLPIKSLGLIIIDESHEPAFKQEQSPRYSALRAASVLASYHGAKVILGSATPSVTDFYLATSMKRPLLLMNITARSSVRPGVSVVDMTKKPDFQKHRFLSDILLQKLQETFASGGQALIFHNRRGSAQATICETCGWHAVCNKCHLPYSLHADSHILRCHLCGKTDKVPTSCPVCHSVTVLHKGIGTKTVESELRKLFPDQTVARFDGDNGPDSTLDARYKELYEGKINLIIGTQIVAKGLDLPNLRLVGIIQADTGLYLPDFSASERTFQLITQVVGRVGRSNHPTSVIVQSYTPHHPAILDGVKQDYHNYYQNEIQERRRAKFPPFVFLLKLTCVYKTEATAIRQSQELAKLLSKQLSGNAEVLGPTPSFYERQRGTFRWQIVVKSKKRSVLLHAITFMPTAHWQFELDPTTLL